MIYLIMEISKLYMFTVLWAFPIVLARMFDNSSYLWFFALSVLVTAVMFTHYEDLEKTDKSKIDNDKEDNE